MDYMTPKEKARIIWENGYIDMKTITGEISDDRVSLLDELSKRICNSAGLPYCGRVGITVADIIEIIIDLRKENMI